MSSSIKYNPEVSGENLGTNDTPKIPCGVMKAEYITDDGNIYSSDETLIYQEQNIPINIIGENTAANTIVYDIPNTGNLDAKDNDYVITLPDWYTVYSSGEKRKSKITYKFINDPVIVGPSQSKNRVKVGQRIIVFYSEKLEGKQPKTLVKTVPVYQKGADYEITYSPWQTRLTFTPANISDAGGEVVVRMEKYRTKYKNYPTLPETENNEEVEESITKFISGKLNDDETRAQITTINDDNIVVQVGKTNEGNERKIPIICWLHEGSKDGLAIAEQVGYILQAQGTKNYGPIKITEFIVDDIPASGGTVNKAKSLKYEQTWGWGTDNTNGGIITDGATITYSKAVTGGNLGTQPTDRKIISGLTVTITMNGKSVSQSISVYQSVNTATYGDLQGGSVTWSDIPASGNDGATDNDVKITLPTQTITYASGATKAGVVKSTKVGQAIIAYSLRDTIKPRTKVSSRSVLFIGEGNKTKTIVADIYQAENKIESGTIDGRWAVDQYYVISARGGDISIERDDKGNQYYFSATYKYTSGYSTESTNNNDFTITKSPSNLTITANNLGKIEYPERKIGTMSVTAQKAGISKTLTVDIWQGPNHQFSGTLFYIDNLSGVTSKGKYKNLYGTTMNDTITVGEHNVAGVAHPHFGKIGQGILHFPGIYNYPCPNANGVKYDYCGTQVTKIENQWLSDFGWGTANATPEKGDYSFTSPTDGGKNYWWFNVSPNGGSLFGDIGINRLNMAISNPSRAFVFASYKGRVSNNLYLVRDPSKNYRVRANLWIYISIPPELVDQKFTAWFLCGDMSYNKNNSYSSNMGGWIDNEKGYCIEHYPGLAEWEFNYAVVGISVSSPPWKVKVSGLSDSNYKFTADSYIADSNNKVTMKIVKK